MSLQLTAEQIERIFTPDAVRERSRRIYESARSGGTHFEVFEDRLIPAAEYVCEVIRSKYPDLQIPVHSRWGHFRAGGVDRTTFLNEKLIHLAELERIKAKLDLVIVSVLLDAGAGMEWKYREEASGQDFSRSEGLAIASFQMFMEGIFSAHPEEPYRVDAERLRRVTLEDLQAGFQVSENNPLVGLEGRLELLHRLGHALESQPTYFGASPVRPGNVIDYYLEKSAKGRLSIVEILKSLLYGLGAIWPNRLQAGHIALGDCWHYRPWGAQASFESLIPFHKLSQWLTYSMMETVSESLIQLTDVERLTGLPEYRNGGFFLDFGVMKLRDPQVIYKTHEVDSELVLEWRALTIILLDQIAVPVRRILGRTEVDFPLPKVLEGGTWWAGRKIAQSRRADGGPPLKIRSDGTVF